MATKIKSAGRPALAVAFTGVEQRAALQEVKYIRDRLEFVSDLYLTTQGKSSRGFVKTNRLLISLGELISLIEEN